MGPAMRWPLLSGGLHPASASSLSAQPALRTPGRREAVGAITIGNQGNGGITPGAYFRASPQAVPAALTRSP